MVAEDVLALRSSVGNDVDRFEWGSGMVARREVGLAAEQIAKLRSDVTAGRRPRVQVSGPQFPAGTTGTVVGVGDAAVDGEDFVSVRVKVGGVTDELGFAPKELSMAGRGRPKASPIEAEPARPARTRRPRKAAATTADAMPDRSATGSPARASSPAPATTSSPEPATTK
jgi:hypothetical protein